MRGHGSWPVTSTPPPACAVIGWSPVAAGARSWSRRLPEPRRPTGSRADAADGSPDVGRRRPEPRSPRSSTPTSPRARAWPGSARSPSAVVRRRSSGCRLGWSWPLLFLLLPGARSGSRWPYVDWRTRLLPTRLIAPSYAVRRGAGRWSAAPIEPATSTTWSGRRSGWLVAGGVFCLLWSIYPPGMGYGDVRLSGVLGIALGYLGWGELLVGIYAGFLVGGGRRGSCCALLRITEDRQLPLRPVHAASARWSASCGVRRSSPVSG